MHSTPFTVSTETILNVMTPIHALISIWLISFCMFIRAIIRKSIHSKESGIECDIQCTTKLSCKSSQISFSDHCDFGNLTCSGSHSCYESEVECNSNGFCELTSSSVRSMKRSTIHCPANSFCAIQCTDFESCSLSDIICDTDSHCLLNCIGDLACLDLEVNAHNASNLQVIQCINSSSN